MSSKYNFSNISKLLEKVFKAGYNTEKDILGIQLDDLEKLNDLTPQEIKILIDLKKAIRNKKLIAFLSCNNSVERMVISNDK